METVLFIKHLDHYLVGDPNSPRVWVGANPAALDALHFVVSHPRWKQSVDAFGGSRKPNAVHQRLHNAAQALAHVSPPLAQEIRRGLKCKYVNDKTGTRSVWVYDPQGATVFVETRPRE
tara:strand:+ start:153514 stop:153870 length:357 start_codon:yes stop_codon:yes gene_type:complete